MAENDGSGFLWFLAGLGIGAAVAILDAPTAGDETRQKIRDAAEQSRDVVADRARQAREQAGTWVDPVAATTSRSKKTNSVPQWMPASRLTTKRRRSSPEPPPASRFGIWQQRSLNSNEGASHG